MEVDNGGGSYQYYNAAVSATSDGTSNALSIVATSASSINSFSAVNSVTGTSYITPRSGQCGCALYRCRRQQQ